jgi:acetyl esterase/lipase
MRMRTELGWRALGVVVAGVHLAASLVVGAAEAPVALWPGRPPGDTPGMPAEADLTKPGENLVAGRRVIRLGHVSEPTFQVFRPPAGKDTGAAVLVCPGGGYHILALDLEGTEVCEWLNSVGVTGVLLKYRVPKRPGTEKQGPALQDAQRAMGLLRSRAGELGIDPARLGVLGFSAGGHLAAALSTTRERTYARIDAADDLACRPDFTVLIYPAYLTVKEENDRISPELRLTATTPPTFLSISADDPVRVEGVLLYTLALKQAGVPVELHVYPTGGHGYGLRRTENPVTFWPDRVGDWMRSRGWLARP